YACRISLLRRRKGRFGRRPIRFPRWTKIPLSAKGQYSPMEDGPDARASLAKAAAPFAVLSLLPVALSGSAPFHASAALRPISFAPQAESSAGGFPWSSPRFAALHSDRGHVI